MYIHLVRFTTHTMCSLNILPHKSETGNLKCKVFLTLLSFLPVPRDTLPTIKIYYTSIFQSDSSTRLCLLSLRHSVYSPSYETCIFSFLSFPGPRSHTDHPSLPSLIRCRYVIFPYRPFINLFFTFYYLIEWSNV